MHLFCNRVHTGHSRSSKVVDFGTNRKGVWDFLLVNNSNHSPTNRSFRHAAPQFWNKLPHSLRVPYQSGSSLSSSLSSGSNPEPAVNLSHGMFHSRLKTYLFSESFPP